MGWDRSREGREWVHGVEGDDLLRFLLFRRVEKYEGEGGMNGTLWGFEDPGLLFCRGWRGVAWRGGVE